MKRSYLFIIGCLFTCSFLLSACGNVTGGSPANIYSGAVFISDRDTAGTNELFISDSETAEVSKLSSALVIGGNVKSFLVNPNIGFIAYLADQDIAGVDELYSIKQSVGIPGKLNTALSAGQNITSYEWSPNGVYMVYLVNQLATGINEIYVSDGKTVFNATPSGLTGNTINYEWSPNSQTIAYTAQLTPTSPIEVYVSQSDGDVVAKQISDSSSIGSGVIDFEWAPNSTLLAYLADQDATGVIELYTTTSDVRASTKVSTVTDGDVQAFKWSNGSTLLAYSANPAAADDTDLFITSPDNASVIPASSVVPGGTVTPDFLWAPNDTFVAYVADQDVDDVFELYVTAFDGSSTGIKVSATLVKDGDVDDTTDGFVWMPLSNQLVYRADQDTDEVFELYVSTIDSAGAITAAGKISDSLGAGRSVDSDFKLSSFGTIVAYIADQETDDVFNLYVTTIAENLDDGTTDDVKLSANTDLTRTVFQYAWSTDGSKIFYITDQTVDGVNDGYTTGVTDLVNLNLTNSPTTGAGVTQGAFIDTFGVSDNVPP